MKRAVILLLMVLLCAQRWAVAAEEMLSFKSPEQQELFIELTHEYRCLKCQNQTIASSNADLAGDLRNEIYTMVLEDKSREEIDGYLVQRYGDFVLYKPRFKASTLLLWLGPAALLALAVWFAVSTARRNNRSAQEPDQIKLEKARSLLKKSS